VGAPLCPILMRQDGTRGPVPQLEVEASALAISILSPNARRCRIAPARDPVACCGGGSAAGEAGRSRVSNCGDATTASDPSHSINRAKGAAP
jgi:hypothetical protein